MENESGATMPQQEQGQEVIGKMSGWYLAMGIFLVIAGIAAMITPVATTFITNVFLGWFLIFAGIIQFFAAIVNRKDGGMWIGMLMGILATILGFMMVSNIAASVASITLMMGAFFLVDGIIKTFQSIFKRPAHWGWMLTSGLISLLLAFMILTNLLSSSLVMIGIFAGVYMLFAGIDVIVLYYASKK
jgi:uncharacterized membrane protein HdeD (DUF308 family)